MVVQADHIRVIRKLRAAVAALDTVKADRDALKRNWDALMTRATLAEAVLIEATNEGGYCPGCGCDWDDEHDPHQEGCPYLIWRDNFIPNPEEPLPAGMVVYR